MDFVKKQPWFPHEDVEIIHNASHFDLSNYWLTIPNQERMNRIVRGYLIHHQINPTHVSEVVSKYIDVISISSSRILAITKSMQPKPWKKSKNHTF